MADDRRRLRRHTPDRKPLLAALAAARDTEKVIADAERRRGEAFLAAAKAGWSMREIAAETGVGLSTVCRIMAEHG